MRNRLTPFCFTELQVVVGEVSSPWGLNEANTV